MVATAAPSDTVLRDDRHTLRRVWAGTLPFWIVLGLLESTTAYVRMLGSPRALPFVHSLVANMPWWLLWAALSPLVFALARRVPLHGERWARGVAVHLVAGLVVAVLHIVLEAVTFYHTVPRGPMAPGFAVMLRNFLGGYLVLGFVTYWVIVGGWNAFDFYARYRTSALRSARLELGLAQARMQALRAELNPQLFFNALNAVSGLVRREENDAAVRMLARLGDLLRVTLDRELAPRIPLRDELELLDRYLDIERVRFGDRLTIEIDIAPEAEEILVPALILQPLVENAIRHGIGARPGDARIEIRGLLHDGAVHLTVSDSGEGFRRSGAEQREGIGLSNIRARLRELYGTRASLALENAADGGASVTLAFPAEIAAGHRVEANA